jgi:sugar/nucleoside kinase (ribokinase family)/aminoglycoside phosphotransferase (APT) family kinase protein
MYEEAATAIRERFGDIPMKPFKAGTPASVMFKGNAGKAIATLYFNELDNESQDILNAMNPYPQVQNILAGVMLGRLTPEQAVAAIVNLKLPSEYTAEDAATLVEKTQAAMVVAPEPAKEPYLAGLPTAQQAAEHADKLGMLARRSRIEQSLNNLAEGQLAGLLTSLQSETQTPYMPQTAIEPIKQILIMARRGLITRAETINMLIAQSSESYSISEDLAEYWVDQAIDPEVASDLKANANPREAHKVAMVGITVIDLILNRKWDQIPEWLREKLIKNSLVVEGDIPGTVDKKGGLIERFLREELTAEERDQLSNELILGGPACSASRVFGQVTKDGNSRAALFSSVSPDGTTIGLLKPDLDSAGVKTNTDGVMMSFKNPTAKTLIFEMGEGARSFLHNIGASANLTIEAFRQAVEEGQFDKMEIIEFGGVELSALMDHLDEAIAALRAREKKIGKHFVIMLDTVVDPAHKWKKFKINNYAVFREIDVFLTNMDEGGQIFGDAISDNKDKAEEHKRICTYQELLEFFGSKGAKAVFLKMGGLGSVVMTTKDSVFGKHEYRHIPVLAGLKKVSGTGTGDAFSAGAAYAKAYGWDTVKAALFATALGGLCLEHRGGTLGPKNDFRTARFKMQELTAQPEVEASLKGELSVDKSVQVSTILEQLSVVSHPILLPGELLSELTRPGKVYATVVDALEYRGDKKKIAEIADAVQKVEEVINAFNRFQGLFKVTSGNCTVELITAGRVNLANYLLILDTGEKFIVQQPNPVFGFEAMNSNLKTFLDTAQPAAMADAKRDNGKFPRTWQAVDYLRTDNGNILFYTNPQEPNKGAAWRVMKFVDGKVFNSLEEAAQCAEAEYREKKKEQNQPVDEQEMEAYKKKYIEDIVRSMGEAMVDFRWMLEQANIEGESLPNFHNTARYAGQVEALANGGTAVVNPSCLKDGAPKTKMAEGLMGSPYAGRVKYMLAEFEKRTDLAHALDGAGEAGQHGDTKINNFMFDPKTRKVICLIDLDTMQKGRAVDDFGDAGRLIINLSGEDPRDEKGQRDINRVSVSIGLLKVMTEAYLARIEHYYGAEERKRLGPYLHQSVRVFLHELSMRFFTSFFTELVEPDPTIDSNNPIEVRKRTHGTYFGLREGEDPDKNLWAAEVQARTLQEYEKALAQKGLLKTEFAREPVVSPAAPAQMVLPHPQPALSAV